MTKQELQIILEFLKRVQLNGAEAMAFVQVQQKIVNLLKDEPAEVKKEE
jgi:hypothetical protein